MSDEDYRKYFETLELSPDAPLSEVRKAYRHLRELYSKDSYVTSPIDDEMSDTFRQETLRKIEAAYAEILELFARVPGHPAHEGESPAANGQFKEPLADDAVYTGSLLREIREDLRIDLHEIALATKILTEHLKNIEAERFEALPHEIFVKGYLVDYAKYLALDPRKVVDDYMNRFHRWKNNVGT